MEQRREVGEEAIARQMRGERRRVEEKDEFGGEGVGRRRRVRLGQEAIEKG
jgi:hypothetical protein